MEIVLVFNVRLYYEIEYYEDTDADETGMETVVVLPYDNNVLN